jgi:hypothetical protein
MAASVQASAKRVCFYWHFFLFVAAGTTAWCGELLPSDFVSAFYRDKN